MDNNLHDGDNEFSPKLCNQIHKRVMEQIENLSDKCAVLENHLSERLKLTKENLEGQLEHKDALIKKEIQLTLGSIKSGVDKLTDAINTQTKKIKENEDAIKEIPTDTKKQLKDLQDWRSKYSGGAKIAGVFFILIQGVFLLYHNHVINEAYKIITEAQKLIGG